MWGLPAGEWKLSPVPARRRGESVLVRGGRRNLSPCWKLELGALGLREWEGPGDRGWRKVAGRSPESGWLAGWLEWGWGAALEVEGQETLV